MSKQRTIWEKMSTLWPPALRRGSSLSSSTSLPADRIRACKWKSGARGSYTSLNSATIFSSAPGQERDNKTTLVILSKDVSFFTQLQGVHLLCSITILGCIFSNIIIKVRFYAAFSIIVQLMMRVYLEGNFLSFQKENKLKTHANCISLFTVSI